MSQQPATRPLRVFLCHSSGDKPAVRSLYQRLKEAGFRPWLDEEDILAGQDWRYEIPRAVKSSDVVIVCLTRAATAKRGYIQKEIVLALDTADQQPEGSIFVIPLRLEECDVPDRLSRWHWVDLYKDDGYHRLLRSLSTVSSGPVPSDPLRQEPAPAILPPVDIISERSVSERISAKGLKRAQWGAGMLVVALLVGIIYLRGLPKQTHRLHYQETPHPVTKPLGKGTKEEEHPEKTQTPGEPPRSGLTAMAKPPSGTPNQDYQGTPHPITKPLGGGIKEEERPVKAQPRAEIPHIGLTAVAEPVSPSGTYPVRLTWQTPAQELQFDIVRTRLDSDEEAIPIPIPWLLGTPGRGPTSEKNQTFRDSGVLPMTPYRYTVRPQQESVEVKTSGNEFRINGRRKLADLDLKSRTIHRLVLEQGAELLTEGRDLEIKVIELVAEDAVIRTFPEDSVASEKGRPGGLISIRALRSSGHLTIYGGGEKGGKGGNVTDRPRAGKGKDGNPSRTSTRGGREERESYCSTLAGQGGKGETGLAGLDGKPGYQGGDSAKIEVLISQDSALTVRAEHEPGKGGDGGDRGKEGKGGPGGDGGKKSAECPEGPVGLPGNDGQPGKNGDVGPVGMKLACCVKIGGKTQQDCGACGD